MKAWQMTGLAVTVVMACKGRATWDFDGDGVGDEDDNCVFVESFTQADGDQDGVGDACDECPDLWGQGLELGCPQVGCGDGTVNAGEQCDDGNHVDGDGCSATCHTEVPPSCGDGTLDAGEQCDDGNHVDGDGCSATCHTEGQSTCGNSIVEAGEVCDDGNTTGADGCSADCTFGCQLGDGCFDAAACICSALCEGSGACGTMTKNCMCPVCAADAACTACNTDGICDPITEFCNCVDCAPYCP